MEEQDEIGGHIAHFRAGHNDGTTMVMNEVENVLGHAAAKKVNREGHLFMVYWTHPLSGEQVWLNMEAAEALTDLFRKAEL